MRDSHNGQLLGVLRVEQALSHLLKNALLWALAPGCGLALAGGCAEDHIIHGQEFDTAGGTGFFGATSVAEFGVDGEGLGNYPEPAITRCGDLPADGYPVLGLTSAWGVMALPGAYQPGGGEVEPGVLRLRLSDSPLFDCSEQFAADECEQGGGDGLTCGWGIELTLSPEELQRGTIQLADSNYSDFRVAAGQPAAHQTDPRGSLALHQVTPDCIIGEFFDIEINLAAAPQSGGFVAEICQRQCIPGNGKGC